jgi:hypothetical protein
MSRAKDEEIRLPGITPRDWGRVFGEDGRGRYPFGKMLIGDYFVLTSMGEASAVRSGLQSFYARHSGRQFWVRQRDNVEGEWVCRRIR